MCRNKVCSRCGKKSSGFVSCRPDGGFCKEYKGKQRVEGLCAGCSTAAEGIDHAGPTDLAGRRSAEDTTGTNSPPRSSSDDPALTSYDRRGEILPGPRQPVATQQAPEARTSDAPSQQQGTVTLPGFREFKVMSGVATPPSDPRPAGGPSFGRQSTVQVGSTAGQASSNQPWYPPMAPPFVGQQSTQPYGFSSQQQTQVHGATAQTAQAPQPSQARQQAPPWPERVAPMPLPLACAPGNAMAFGPVSQNDRASFSNQPLPHPLAQQLQYLGYHEPELWQYWRAKPSRRRGGGQLRVATDHERLGWAQEHPVMLRWPLPLPYEMRQEFINRQFNSAGRGIGELGDMNSQFDWREMQDPQLKARSESGTARWKWSGSKKRGGGSGGRGGGVARGGGQYRPLQPAGGPSGSGGG